MDLQTRAENLFALVLSRESGFVGDSTLGPVVQPFVDAGLGWWLLETVQTLVAAELGRSALPEFWRVVEQEEEEQDLTAPDAKLSSEAQEMERLDLQTWEENLLRGRAGAVRLLRALETLGAALETAEGRVASLRAALLGRRAEEERGAAVGVVVNDVVVVSGTAAEVLSAQGPRLRAVLERFATAFLPAHETRSLALARPFLECISWLQRLGMASLLFDCALTAAHKLVDTRLADAAKSWDAPRLNDLLAWVRGDLFSLIAEFGGRARHEQQIWKNCLEKFCLLRAQEMFDIIVGFPEETLAAVNDLRDCVAHLLAIPGGGAAFLSLQNVLSSSLKARLLHPGANTADIIRTYILCIHVLRAIDPSGVALDRVSGPIRSYLVGRSDTIRCIVQSLTDPAGDLFSELSKEPDELQARRATAPEFWEPEAADSLPQSEGVSRHKDVVELLVNIFGGTEPFVAEFKKLLGQRLLVAVDYNVDAELRTLELLKLRFGEASFNECEIMLRDMADSKRVNKLCLGQDPLLEDFSAVMVSYLYWPSSVFSAPSSGLVPSTSLQLMLNKFQANFAQVKASRKLEWNLGLGEVDLDVTLLSGTVLELRGLTFLQATLLELFQQQPRWTAEDLVQKTESDAEAVKRGLRYWVGAGLVRQDGNVWQLELNEENVHAVGQGDMMDESGDEDQGDDLESAEPFVLHMLNNLGGLSVNQIQDQLKNFADVDVPVAALRDHLNAMVVEGKIDLKNNLYVPASVQK